MLSRQSIFDHTLIIIQLAYALGSGRLYRNDLLLSIEWNILDSRVDSSLLESKLFSDVLSIALNSSIKVFFVPSTSKRTRILPDRETEMRIKPSILVGSFTYPFLCSGQQNDNEKTKVAGHLGRLILKPIMEVSSC